MKILHVLAQKPTRTGSGVYFSNVIEGLKKYGHEQAAIFALQDDFVFDVLPADSQYPVYFKSAALPFAVAGMSDVMPYENTIYSTMSNDMINAWRAVFSGVLEQAKAEFAPDVVILHHLWWLTSMAVDVFDAARKIGICHNTDLRQAEQNPDLKEKYVHGLEKLDLVLSLSDDAKPRIELTFGISRDKIVTLGGGFNQNVFYPEGTPQQVRGDKKVNIAYAAKVERSKGIFELVEAFKMVAAADHHLHIIGTPDTANKAKLDALTHGMDNISLVHITNQKHLADYMRTCDIYVMPSFYEGLGLIAIEALASGLFVVATEIDALMALLGETVNNSGIIEYVPLPRIWGTDKPVEEDIPVFINNLANKLKAQINRAGTGDGISPALLKEIHKHSWDAKTKIINDLL
ncbi:MAG: glycosyltransferase family 4 protein [Defluviitaleaceae bacterium]|nr:glycosyltransferase family 4 protein [Defluviitaleaceae bacterium]